MRKVLIAILLAVSLVACGEGGRGSGSSEWSHVGQGVEVRSILVEGIQCIIVEDLDGIALSCNWDTP